MTKEQESQTVGKVRGWGMRFLHIPIWRTAMRHQIRDVSVDTLIPCEGIEQGWQRSDNQGNDEYGPEDNPDPAWPLNGHIRVLSTPFIVLHSMHLFIGKCRPRQIQRPEGKNPLLVVIHTRHLAYSSVREFARSKDRWGSLQVVQSATGVPPHAAQPLDTAVWVGSPAMRSSTALPSLPR